MGGLEWTLNIITVWMLIENDSRRHHGETNNTLRKLTADGAAAIAGSTTNTTSRGPVSFSPTFTAPILARLPGKSVLGAKRPPVDNRLHHSGLGDTASNRKSRKRSSPRQVA